MFAIKLNQAFTDTTLPKVTRDPLIDNDNGGVLFAADFAFPWCYPGGAPINGSVVKDIAESGSNGIITKQGADVISHAGGGLDFSAVTVANNMLEIPADVAAAIWADANQYFLFCMYIKAPLLADWNVATTLRSMAQFATAGYSTGAELVNISQYRSPVTTGAGQIHFNRQYAAAAAHAVILNLNPADHGQIVQVACWRNSTVFNARIKSANGVVSGSSSTQTAANTQNFSALTGKIGTAGSTWGAPNNFENYRLYRAFVESLTTSGRDPATVLDADWTRTIARGVFS